MKLSILTPTVPDRYLKAKDLAAKIQKQIGRKAVEHLIFCDNKQRSIGAKRQALVDIARGKYIAFVDDDDDISDDYVESILAAIRNEPDVITFRQHVSYNGQVGEVEFGVNNTDEAFKPGEVTKRAPWHVCAWKRRKVAGCLFGESNYGEDLIWCRQARNRIQTGKHIDKVLHSYIHDAKTTLAPEKMNAESIHPESKP